jgi:SanA protein
LISGDDGKFHSNEVEVMFSLLEKFGIPANDLLVDGHGYRTYETCRRAKQIYGIQDAILVTQRFHLSRALFLCERLGIHSYGVLADQEGQTIPLRNSLRDILASVKAYIDIYFLKPPSPVPAVANERSAQPDPATTSTDAFFMQDLTNE